VTKSALYCNPGTKEELLFDILDRFALESIARLLEVLADMPDEPAEDVVNTVMRIGRTYEGTCVLLLVQDPTSASSTRSPENSSAS
jgi:AcrR family transcriptional regulator